MGRKKGQRINNETFRPKGQNLCYSQINFAFQSPEHTDSRINSKYQGIYNVF